MRQDVLSQIRELEYRGKQQLLIKNNQPILPIQKESIPYGADIKVGGKTFRWSFYYNVQEDYFTLSLAKEGELLVAGEPLVYGQQLFIAHWRDAFPLTPLVPLDLAGNERRVGWAQLHETVYIYAPPPGWEDQMPL